MTETKFKTAKRRSVIRMSPWMNPISRGISRPNRLCPVWWLWKRWRKRRRWLSWASRRSHTQPR